jgi:hypothetical protein
VTIFMLYPLGIGRVHYSRTYKPNNNPLEEP